MTAGTGQHGPAAVGCAVVVGFAGAAAALAGRVAERAGVRLELLAPGADGVPAARATIRAAGGPALIVALPGDLTDALLTGLLRDLELALAAGTAWHRLPRWTLLTGRDLPALTRVAERMLGPRPTGDGPRRLVQLLPDRADCVSSELVLGASGEPAVTRRQAAGADVPPLLRRRADVVAVRTHGSDACARGGDGAVLCGLRPGGRGAPDRPGALACGQGLDCPRGPRPVPLGTLGAGLLMTTSCNGLRLGGANTQPDFNLALSFLDGPGHGYVGSVSSALVTDATAVAFLAALASGRDLAEAVTTVNALMACAGLDQPTYAAVGLPGYRLGGPPAPEPEAEPAGDLLEVEATGRHLVAVRVRDAGFGELARGGRLALAAEAAEDSEDAGGAGDSAAAEGPDARYWFARAEPDGSTRLVLFSFPEPLGRLRLRVRDTAAASGAVAAALDALAGWQELWRLLHTGEQDADVPAAVEQAAADARAAAARTLPLLRYDLTGPARLDRIAERVEGLRRAVRDLLLEHLVPQLAGSFYLTNALVGEYGYQGAEPGPCPHCASPAARKHYRHPLTGRTRLVEVCTRCGIVTDVPGGGRLGLELAAPELMERGGEVRVRVAVTAPAGDDVVLACRLSTHGHADVATRPALAHCRGDGAAEFELTVPADLPPHEYSVKALAAGRDGLAFGHRLTWVR